MEEFGHFLGEDKGGGVALSINAINTIAAMLSKLGNKKLNDTQDQRGD